MAVITDLTLQQWLNKLPPNALVITAGKVMMDVSIVGGITADALTDFGVIKILANALNAAYLAQQDVNIGQITGEKLAALGTPTVGQISNGYAPITRTFVSRSELASATNIVGQVN